MLGLALTTLVIISIAYGSLGALQSGRMPNSQPNPTVVRHLSILFLFFLGTLAWGYYLDRFELLYSTLGVVYGVGYTTDHVTRISLWIMVFASLALGALILLNMRKPRFRTGLVEVGGFFLLYFIIIVILPGLVQKFKVAPSELELETPYLKHNILFTRKAFQLDRIDEKAYPALTDLKPEDIARNQDTIDNKSKNPPGHGPKAKTFLGNRLVNAAMRGGDENRLRGLD